MQTTLSTVPKITTDRPAQLLPGFYAIQALSNGGLLPNITQYHRKAGPAFDWFVAMTRKKVFDGFAFLSLDDRWRVFDRHGKMIETRTWITSEDGVFKEVHCPVKVDAVEYVQSVKEILGDTVCCLTFAEHHSHASSVGHSNMVVVAQQMIMDATDEDLEHIYLADSIASGCRVHGWFMDSAKVSSQFMDKYLDRYKWLTNGWPSEYEHYMQILAYRMATLRPLQVISILLTVGEHENLGESNDQVALRILQAPPEKLIKLTSLMLDVLEEGMFIESAQDLEKIEDDTILEEAETIARMYRDMFLM